MKGVNTMEQNNQDLQQDKEKQEKFDKERGEFNSKKQWEEPNLQKVLQPEVLDL